jgi:hypothetical protein
LQMHGHLHDTVASAHKERDAIPVQIQCLGLKRADLQSVRTFPHVSYELGMRLALYRSVNTKYSKLVMGTALGLSLSLLPAGAIPVNVTMMNDLSVIAAPASALGNFGDSTVFNWLKADVTAYDTASGAAYPAPIANANGSPLTKVETPSGGSSITITVPSHEYVFLHWGGQNGGWAQAFYNPGSTLDYTFTAPPGGSPSVGGLSFYSEYGPGGGGSVPDGGVSIMLLSATMGGMFIVRRVS